MKSFSKYILLGVLFLGLFGCEYNDERIEYMLYIENHSDQKLSLKTESGTSVDECILAPHEMICVKRNEIIASKSEPVLGSESNVNNPGAHIHYFILQDKVFDNLYYQEGEAWKRIEDTEDSPYRGCNYKYDSSISYGKKKCFVYQMTIE